VAVSKIRDRNTGKIVGYRAEVYMRGVRVADRTFDNKGAAQHWHDMTKGKAKKGFLINLTFGDVFRDYMAGPFQSLRATTRRAREPRIKYLQNCPLSHLYLSDMAPIHITNWIDWMKEVSVGHRRQNFKEELVFLVTVLNWHKDHRDPSFVLPVMKPHRRKQILHKDVAPRRKDYFMPAEQVRSWLEVMERSAKRVYFELAKFMVHTGLRVEEAAALEWSKVNLQTGSLRIEDSMAWGPKPYWQGKTKNESSNRIIRIPPVLLELLHSIKNRGILEISWPGLDGRLENRSPIFLNHKNKPLTYERIRHHFNNGFKALGLEWSGTHIMRHTFATLSFEATSSIAKTQATLGHSSEKQTREYAKVYSVQFGDSLDKTADLIAGRNHA